MKSRSVFLVIFGAWSLVFGGGSIEYYGHAVFRITTDSGTRIVIDPAEFKGYKMPGGLEADVVTISHDHMDHSNTSSLAPGFLELHGCTDDLQNMIPVDTMITDVHIHNLMSWHNPAKTGLNSIFIYEFDGVRVVHLGDLGVPLTMDQAVAISDVDVLLLPVGGKYTIGLEDAHEVVEMLCHNTFVIPMHFKTEAFDYLPNTAEDFLKGKDNVVRVGSYRMENPALTNATGVVYYLLDYTKR